METILQITSGRGPAECCWVVAQILKQIITEASKKGIQHTVLHRDKGYENGTLFSAVIKLEGKGSEELSLQWTGSILWVGQSQFRKFHKRKNWFIAVNKLDYSNQKIVINDNDISYQAIRSGGPGGQHVNKVSTAIRATHLPSGIQVHVSESRSQLQNKKLAKQRLIDCIDLKQLHDFKRMAKAEWSNHDELQRGNPVKTFYGTDFKTRKNSKSFKNKRQLLKQSLKKELLD